MGRDQMSLRDKNGGKWVRTPAKKSSGGKPPRKTLAYRRVRNVEHRMLPYGSQRDTVAVPQDPPKDETSDDDSDIEIPEELSNSPVKGEGAAGPMTSKPLADSTNQKAAVQKSLEKKKDKPSFALNDEYEAEMKKQLKAEKENKDWEISEQNKENAAQMEYVFSQFP